MNPFQGPVKNPLQGMMNFADRIRTVMQNPSSIADVMLEQGKIDKNTYNAVKGMNPQQIGQYMMQNGLIDPQRAQQAYQTEVPRYMG